MSDPVNYRMERIERLLRELRHEVTRGMLEGEIDEEMGYQFIIPVSKRIKDGEVFCEFRTIPTTRGHRLPGHNGPRLKVVE